MKTRIELPGQRVLDMCAGPGGKTLAMLQTMRRIFSVLDKFVGKGEGVGSVRNTVEVPSFLTILAQFIFVISTGFKPFFVSDCKYQNCIVMSVEPDMLGKEVDSVPEERAKEKERVSDKEKDLASEASSALPPWHVQVGSIYFNKKIYV